MVGLASGVGFGVSEGITYCGDHYNGIHGIGIYVIRFLSCVSLHALWAGSVAILIYRNRDYLEYSWEAAFFFVVYYLMVMEAEMPAQKRITPVTTLRFSG